MVVIPAPAVVLTMAGRRFDILFPYQNLIRLFFVFSFHDLSILYYRHLSKKNFRKFLKITLAITMSTLLVALSATKKIKIIKIVVSRCAIGVYGYAAGLALPQVVIHQGVMK